MSDFTLTVVSYVLLAVGALVAVRVVIVLLTDRDYRRPRGRE